MLKKQHEKSKMCLEIISKTHTIVTTDLTRTQAYQSER